MTRSSAVWSAKFSANACFQSNREAAARLGVARMTKKMERDTFRKHVTRRARQYSADIERERFSVVGKSEVLAPYFWDGQTPEERRTMCRYVVALGIAEFIHKDVR